jgi:hypothetical protein
MTRCLSWRRWPGAALLWALAALVLAAACCRAEDAPPPAHRMENRFLFVIDTSSAMKSRTNGLLEAVSGLLGSGMKGQLREGDTIGLWTYSDRLNTDFPMQVWSEPAKDDILHDVREHLEELVYAKRAHLEKALPAIVQAMAKSERLTVLLVFDGSDPVKGTPFDKDINELHKKYSREFKAAHAPFVTVLAARKGKVFDYTINYPGSVVVPLTADPLPPPKTNAPPPVAASAPPPPVTAIPPSEPNPPPRRIEITLSGSNAARKVADAPAAPVYVAPVAPSAPAPVPTPAPAVVSNVPPPVVAVPVAAQVVTPNFTPPAPAPAAAVPAPTVPAALPPPAVTPPGQQLAMFIMAFSLLTIAVVLVLFLVRRSRGGRQPSLISQSIDRSR